MADIVLPNLQAYCKRHGYEYRFVCFPEPCESDFGFRKLTGILDLFNEGFDVVVSFDLDLLITNHNYKIEQFLTDEHDFFICKDYNGINAGSFIVRNSGWLVGFLDWLLRCRGIDKIHCEQDAIAYYMRLFPNDEKIKILPHPSINSYLYENYPDIPQQTHERGQWQPTDFILHLPGLGMETRLDIMKKTPIIL
jgi:hypothetical protein